MLWRLVKTVAGSVVLLFPPMPIIINPNDEPKDIGLGSIACRITYPFSETSRRVWKRGKYFCEGKKAGPTETLGEEGGCLKELRWLFERVEVAVTVVVVPLFADTRCIRPSNRDHVVLGMLILIKARGGRQN